jgi:hypothetical protein
MRTRRTISYLTCTTSRASKNSDETNSSSVTASGREFKLRSARSASTFGSCPLRATASPSESHECKLDYATTVEEVKHC